MKFSISIAMAEPSHYCALAKTAEACGYHAVVAPDAIFYTDAVDVPYPYTRDGTRFWSADTPWIDPLVAIAAMAAVTERVRFYTSVLKLPVRNPLLVAKQVASVAVLSGDRFALGAGLGWQPEEFAWCGTDYASRGKRADEMLEILRLVWAGGMVEYHGTHYDFGKLQMSPAPARKIPIYIGGHSRPALRRAAHYGDGWVSAMLRGEQILDIAARLEQLRRELGRHDDPFDVIAVPTDVVSVNGYAHLAEHGVTEIITMPWALYGAPVAGASLEAKRDGIERFADDVIRVMADSAGVPAS